MQNNTNHHKLQIVNYIIIWIFFEGLFCWLKYASKWRLQEVNFRHIPLVVFSLGIFCKLVFFKLQNMRWPSNVTWNINWCPCSKWLKPPNIYRTHWYSVTKRVLLLSKIPLPKNGTQNKWHLTTTLLVFWSTTNILLIEPIPTTIKHRRVPGISFWIGKNLTLKSHDHESESYNTFKNFILKITLLSPCQIR